MLWKVAILTVSDTGSNGETEGTSAQVIRELVNEELQGEVIEYRTIPAEMDEIMASLIEITDYYKVDLIITSGGVGFSPRDCTPEATKQVIDKEAPGLSETMRQFITDTERKVYMSRAISGIRDQTLIMNLPGSPKGVHESLAAIIDQLPYALRALTGKTGEYE